MSDWRRTYASDSRALLSTARAVRLGIVTGLLSFSLLLVASQLWRTKETPAVRPPVRAHDATVDIWVGEWTKGVTCVLASPWNQAAWDKASDATLHSPRDTGLPADYVLYDCWLFNMTDHAVTVSLTDGSLLVTPAPPLDATLPLRSLSAWLSPKSGARPPDGGPATVLRALGADRDTIELPSGRMIRHPVALAERVALGTVRAVTTADGTPFRLRQMAEPEWAELTQSPRRADLENYLR